MAVRGAGAMAQGDPLAAVREALVQGRAGDALQGAEAVLATNADPAARVQATAARAEALAGLGRLSEAIAFLRASRGQERAAGHAATAATLGLEEARAHSANNDLNSAIEALMSAANDFGAAGDPADQIRAQLEVAAAYASGGRSQTTGQIIADCVGAARRLGDAGLLAEVLYQQGNFQLAGGQPDVARATAEEGLQAADSSPNIAVRIQFRVALGAILASIAPSRAAGLLAEAEALVPQLPTPIDAGGDYLAIAQAWKLNGRVNDSLRCGQAALGTFRGANAWPLYVNAGIFIADLYGPQARQYAQEYIDLAGRIGGAGAQAESLAELGQSAYQRGDHGSARNLWYEAVSTLGGAGLPVPQQLQSALQSVSWGP